MSRPQSDVSGIVAAVTGVVSLLVAVASLYVALLTLLESRDTAGPSRGSPPAVATVPPARGRTTPPAVRTGDAVARSTAARPSQDPGGDIDWFYLLKISTPLFVIPVLLMLWIPWAEKRGLNPEPVRDVTPPPF